jgi:DNA-directed RNA polymerase subunit RPC12/RpoP
LKKVRMGHSIKVECGNCKQSQEFTLGVGMMYSSLNKVLDLVPTPWRAEILGILKLHKVRETNYEHQTYHCPRCHRLYENFHVYIDYDEGQMFETSYKCDECKVTLEPVTEDDIPNLPCERCGERALTTQEVILWD